jgi:hypothetical protein
VGTPISLTVTPDSGYGLKPGTLKYNDGTTDTPINETTRKFTMPASNVTVSAEFGPLYDVTIPGIANGTVTSSPVNAAEGTEISLTIDADPGYGLKAGTLKYSDGVNDTPINETTREFTMPAYNVTIKAEFEPLPYTVSIGSVTHGTLIPSSGGGTLGTSITLEIKPDSGYGLKAGTLKYNDGTNDTLINETTKTFTMPASNVTVSAQFEPFYTVTINGSITNGTVTSSPESGPEGTVISLTVTPVSELEYWLKPGTLKYSDGTNDTLINETTKTFTIPASNVTVSAQFEPRLYTVGIGSMAHGTVTPSSGSGTIGTSITLTAVPSDGYRLKDGTFKVVKTADNTSVGSPSGNTYNFAMPAADVTVSAEFETIPGLIHDAVDLSKIGTTAYYPMDRNYELTTNITLPSGWTPIGSGDTPFTGTFDGKDKTITINSFPSAGVNISSAFGPEWGIPGDIIARGLLAYTENAAVKDLNITVNLSSPFVITSTPQQVQLFGTVAAAAMNTAFTNINISGGGLDVNASATNNGLILGGIVGLLMEGSSITGCSMSGDVEVSGGDTDNTAIGGLSGSAQGTIKNSFVSGNVSLTSTAGSGSEVKAGGLTGELGNVGDENDPLVFIRKSYSTGTVSATSATAQNIYVGGIAASTSRRNIEITDCYSTGAVSASGGPSSRAFAGGIEADALAGDNCSNTVTIARCYASGNISAADSGDNYAGGIAGRATVKTGGSGSITACAALSVLVDGSGGTATRIAGASGSGAPFPLSNNIANDAMSGGSWTDDANGQDGADKNNAELADSATYIGWNFSTVWRMQGGRPVLQWQ